MDESSTSAGRKDKKPRAEMTPEEKAADNAARRARAKKKEGGGGTGNKSSGMDQNPMMQMMQMMRQMSGAADPNPAKKKKQKVSEVSGSGGSTGDAWTDEQLDKWIAAKRSKDYVTADAIRDELRSMGVDPDVVRPRGWDGSGTGGGKSNISKGMDENPMMQMMQMMMQMSGSAASGPSKKTKQTGKVDGQSQLEKATPEQKVWVGGLTANITWKELQQHFNSVSKSKWVEKLTEDSACVVYENAEDAAMAIAMLSGSMLDSATIECSAWE